MQNINYDNKFVYVVTFDDKGNVISVPFYYLTDFEKTSNRFKNALLNYQNCVSEFQQYPQNKISLLKLKFSYYKLCILEKAEGIERIIINDLYKDEREN